MSDNTTSKDKSTSTPSNTSTDATSTTTISMENARPASPAMASPASPSASSVPPGFPRLSELGAALTSSTTSIGSETSEAAREEFAIQFLSMGGKPLSPLSSLCMSPVSAARRKKKKAAWTEKYENTAVVIGPVETHELFKELVGHVKEQCGEVKSHYYREEQHCGFIYFHSDQVADKCKEQFDNHVFDGVTIQAKSPSNFFANQEDAFPEHDTPHRPSQPMSPPVSPGTPPSPAPLAPASIEPTPTLVIKNLCFGLKQEKLLEFMAMLKSPPQSVSYHYDNNGLFRGVAFAKYTTAEQAAESLAELDGKEIGGRKLRVEFKRRTSAQNTAATTPTATSPPPTKPAASGLLGTAREPLTPTGMHIMPQPLATTPTTPSGPALPMSHVLQTASAAVPRPAPSLMSNGQPIIRPATDFAAMGAAPRPNLVSSGPPSVPVSLFRTNPQPPVPQVRPIQQDLRQRTTEPVSLFRPHQSFGGIVIREGLEFEHIPSEPSRSQYSTVPPPVSSFKAASMMPVLRAGMEFA